MTRIKDQMVRLIQHNAAGKVAVLADQLVRAAPQEKEAIQAGIDFERWLAETCQACADQPQEC